MSRYVVDASVAVKWLVPEDDSELAVHVLDPEHDLFAPDLLSAEVGNIIWKKQRIGELTRDEGADVLAAFRNAPVRLLASQRFIADAYAIAAHHDRTVYDSLYLAVAVAMDAPMVTADQKLVRALAGTELASSVVLLASMVPT